MEMHWEMKSEALVSVITAAYNCSATIGETIESVMAQTWENWEMLIADDCSTDDTADVVKSYMQKDPRIKYIKLAQNSGSAAARNTAIANAKGKYVALLDADDLWHPLKLEHQIRFMEAGKLAFTFTAYDVFKQSSDKQRKIFQVPHSVNYKQFLRNTIIGCLTVVIDKEQIPDFHMESGYLEDTLTWMYYLRSGLVAYGLNENLASYRVSAVSKSGNKIKNAIRYYHCLEQQPGLNLVQRLFCEAGYVFHAVKKRAFSPTTADD